jgi:hypothetical protein
VLTYLDANVLIYAVKGETARAERAFSVLDDPSAAFASSAFLELELLPNSREEQRLFYDLYFRRVSIWARDYSRLIELARTEAVTHGIAAIDALHLAAAASVGARLVTFEKRAKPLFRSAITQIVSLSEEP